MKEEIRERIDRIKKGEVPEGYKKTKVGVIPENWEINNISEFCNDIFLGLTSKVDYVESEGFPLIRAKDINCGKLNFDNAKYISESQHRDLTKYRKPERDDVLVSKSGTLGTCCIVDTDKEFSVYESIIVLKGKANKLHSTYLLQMLREEKVQSRMIGSKVGGTVGHLNLKHFRELDVALPSFSEQQKIASILSTWDKAIELKEQLVEAKKEQKKGLMKRLLTGKTRLPGFDRERIYLKAGDMFENVTDKSHKGIGRVLSSTQDQGIIPRDELEIDIKFDKGNLSSYKKVNVGEFIISLRSFQGGIEYSEFEGLVSPAYTVLRNKIPIENAFYKHFFKSTDFITRLNGLIYGIRDGKQIGYKDFSVMKLPYPSIAEQKYIGEILDLATKEINTIQQELSQLKQQKKGLMQLLLTGIVRVQ